MLTWTGWHPLESQLSDPDAKAEGMGSNPSQFLGPKQEGEQRQLRMKERFTREVTSSWEAKTLASESCEVDSRAATNPSIGGSVLNYSDYQPSRGLLRMITKQARDTPNIISARRQLCHLPLQRGWIKQASWHPAYVHINQVMATEPQ